MTPRFRSVALLLLRLLVMAAALLFLARGVAWAEVAETLRGASPALLLAVVAVNGCMIALKAVRLRLLLGGTPSFKSSLLAKLTASAINNVVPFRGGDMARLWMLERHAQISKSAAAAVALVEGLFELLTLATVALVGALAVSGQRWAVGAAPLLLAAAATLLIALKYVNGRSAEGPLAAPRSEGLAGRLRAFGERMEPGMRALRRPGAVGGALVLSFAVWGLEVIMVMLCARSIHLSIDPALAAVTLLGINLALALPSMPASAGAFEGGALVVLMLSGIAKGTGVAFALLYHVVQVIPVTLVGVGIVSKVGITLDRLPVRQSMEVQQS
jgi:glycosyltransferase 2 family protein